MNSTENSTDGNAAQQPGQAVTGVRRYQDISVTGPLVDFPGVAGTNVGDLSQVSKLIENFAATVWPAL